jgi:hypothetical protein
MEVVTRAAAPKYMPTFKLRQDLFALKKHALKIFDEMSGFIKSSPYPSSEADADPEANFILGGYSWIKKKFETLIQKFLPSSIWSRFKL